VGIDRDSTLKELLVAIREKYDTFSGVSMVELGNQRMAGNKEYSPTTGKKYFSSLEMEHTSIDMNGEDGALVRNLCTEITDILPADIVTNFGTSEHVADQQACFKNIHNFCKQGGIMFHLVPPQGAWPGHCPHYYTQDFFKRLAKANGYKVLKNEIFDDTSTGAGRKYVGKTSLLLCILEKQNDNKFKGLGE
tara:strand:- start:45 stop:620 length:576 start_codon:yes stop_codon:yes gene_type:complete